MSDFPKDAPSIRDKDAPHKKIKKTNVKNYPGLGYAPTIKEGRKPKPLGAMVGKAYELDARAQKEKSISKKQKLEDRARLIQMAAYEQLDALLTDPLEELYDLYEAEMNVMPKPELRDELPSNYESPNKGAFEHPITQQKNSVNDLLKQGVDPVEAHRSVHGEVDTGSTDSKAKLASTLGRIQDDGVRNAVKIEKGKGSILSQDSMMQSIQDVTHDDMRTPMNQQVPDVEQTPADQVAEELEECYNYMDDVKYLQTYGRA